MARDHDDDNSWHLDKRVPIALIIAIGTQAIGAAVFALKLDSRVEYLEKIGSTQEKRIEALTAERDGSRERLTRLEAQSAQALDLLRQLDGKVDRMWRPSPPPH